MVSLQPMPGFSSLFQEAIVNQKYAIGLYREGHIPVEISSLMYHFLDESKENRIEAVVIGKRKREIGLVIPAKYTAVTTDNMTAKILLAELRKKKEKYKHSDLELLNETACKTPVITNNYSPTVYSNERPLLRSGGTLIREGALIKDFSLKGGAHSKGVLL